MVPALSEGFTIIESGERSNITVIEGASRSREQHEN
jgi:hypothetical protein